MAVLVDLWQPDEPDTEALQSVELAASFAATAVSDVFREGGGSLSVGISGPEPRWVSGPISVGLVDEAMEHLAMAAASGEDHLPKLLRIALDRIKSGTEIVLVATRPVDLTDRGRFGPLYRDSIRNDIAGRIRLVDSSRSELSELFQVE